MAAVIVWKARALVAEQRVRGLIKAVEKLSAAASSARFDLVCDDNLSDYKRHDATIKQLEKAIGFGKRKLAGDGSVPR